MPAYTDEELLAYIDEMLPAERMAVVEGDLRTNESLRRRAAGLSRRRDHGVHSVGDIWRRQRLSCPSRKELGGMLLGTLEADAADYVEFHVRTIGCRYCLANLADLETEAAAKADSTRRRKKFFQSSAGYLKLSESNS